MTLSQVLRALILVVATGGTGLSARAAQSPSDIPIRDFFRLPAVRAPQLSPDGRRIAMLVPAGKNRVGLAMADTATPEKFVGVAQFEDADIRSFEWVNDQRLVFDAIDFQAPVAYQTGSGLYAVNADGSEFVWLIERNGNYRTVGVPSVRPLTQRHQFVGTLDDGSDDVLVQRWNFTESGRAADSTMVRLNTKSITTRSLITTPVPEGAQQWVLDRTGKPRVIVTAGGYFDTNMTIHWRPENSDEWEVLTRFDAVDPPPTAFNPIAVDYDGTLLVSTISGDRTSNPDRVAALHRYDSVKRAIDPTPLLSLKGFDYAGQLVFDRSARKLAGITYTTDASGVTWLDAGMRNLQESVDKQLPGTNNLLACRRCSTATHFVVVSYSDRQSPVYFLMDRATAKLKLLGASRPWLDSRLLAEQDFQRIKARDGMEIPVYVTKPKGKGPWPTVVLVHGGPYVRGHAWGFNPDGQFLASRGYLVVETEFRGSTGYGDRLFKAGWKQWGLTMQDDVTDATRWAIQQGLADPKRIAIAGASYGGYATMMGLLKEPALYKAGINWVGVTDIELMYDIGWSDFMGSQWMRFGMPRMIGDPKKDAEQLKATSPLQQASRINQPVLMAYGEEDLRVPLPHGVKMRDALVRAGNKNVEWVQYKDEGHGFMLLENNVDFWSRVERFLGRHLR